MLVLAASVLMAAGSAWVSELLIGKRVQQEAHAKLEELLDTVERTASIACFVGDEQLAGEVAHGLLRNSEVAGVTIVAGDRRLAFVTRERVAATSPNLLVSSVSRTLFSPFDAAQSIGEIRLDAAWTVIEARIAEDVRLARHLLLSQLLLAVSATAGALYLFVLRPIKAVSDQLHQLQPADGGRFFGAPDTD